MRVFPIVLAAAAALAASVAATPAKADWYGHGGYDRGWHGGYDRGWREGPEWHHHWRPWGPAFVFAPPPPPVVYVRPPVAYAPPPPAYYAPPGYGYYR